MRLPKYNTHELKSLELVSYELEFTGSSGEQIYGLYFRGDKFPDVELWYRPGDLSYLVIGESHLVRLDRHEHLETDCHTLAYAQSECSLEFVNRRKRIAIDRERQRDWTFTLYGV